MAAGALAFRDAVRLVHLRGTLMYEAGQQRPGTMAAVLGVDREAAERLCRSVAGAGIVVPANLNAPGQVVISGERAAVEAAAAAAEGFGAKKRRHARGERRLPLAADGAGGPEAGRGARRDGDPRRAAAR